MKKVLFGLFALSTVALAAETNLYLRAGADLNGEYDVINYEGDINKKDADEFSYEFAVEATREIYPNLEVGVGLAYQKHGNPKTYTESGNPVKDYSWTYEAEMVGYTSIPLYLTAKYNFNAINNFVPYIKANLGYSFNDEDGDAKDVYKDTSIYDGKVTHHEYPGKYDIKLDNGLYYGIGAGFEYNNFTMDLMYQVNETEAKITDKEYPEYNFKKDYDYSRVTLSFGYKFNF